jgi:iron complex transport system substrate-binding protein
MRVSPHPQRSGWGGSSRRCSECGIANKVILSHRGLLSHALTLGVKPIGSNANSLEDLKGKYLREASYLGKKIEGIPQVGLPDNPNLEKIFLLKPDLILAWESPESLHPLLSQVVTPNGGI